MFNKDKTDKNNDWLAEELDREKKTSARDLDKANGSKSIDQFVNKVEAEDEEKKKDVWLERWLDIDPVIAFGFLWLNYFLDNKQWWPPVFLILCICPGMFIWPFIFRKDMPAWYLILIGIVTIVLEYLVLFEGRQFN